MRRYGPGEARLTVTEGRRLLVRFTATSPAIFDDLRASFRAHFPQHGTAYYDAQRRCWSLPLSQRRRLDDWIGSMFEPAAYDEDQAADRSA